jgi:beta-lactamase class A
MLRTIRNWLLVLFLLAAAGFALYSGFQYRLMLSRQVLPPGTTIANVAVGGLNLDEATSRVSEAYAQPLYIYHGQEHVEVNPMEHVAFVLDTPAMVAEAQQAISSRNQWLGFVSFVLKQPVQPIHIPLRATHDRDALLALLNSIAAFLDQPARGPQMLATDSIHPGRPGSVTDIDASLPLIEDALYRINDRVVRLVLDEQPVPEMSMDLLRETIEGKLQSFDGMGSIYILDLQTGEELSINGDVAMSGLSILKIAIFIEAYRALDAPPNEYVQGLFLDTAAASSNFGANLLLHVVAGEDNTYKGADILTESMRRLGLVNTFMAVPYDATPPGYRRTTYVTPANSRTDINIGPDETMQSTAEEIGSLLAMIYYCSKGGGTLLAVYPDQFTPQECQAIIDLMILNEEGNLIRFGVPQGTPVSHKHGWALATHADAGIVYSPGGDFVIVEYLHQPGEWLLADVSFPILREIARAAYNYFNMDAPYLGDPLLERDIPLDPDDPFGENQGPEEPAAEPDEQEAQPESPAETPSEAPTETPAETPTETPDATPTPPPLPPGQDT